MIGWAILGIVIIAALAGGVVWWFCADARRARARRRLTPARDTDPATPECEWSVAAIAARLERERDTPAPTWPDCDADTPGPAPERGDRVLTPAARHDRPDDARQFPPQRTAARQRPYILPSPRPRHPPPSAAPELTATPRLGLPLLSPPDLNLLERIHEGLKHL
jgi:hypothetical protein